MKNFKIYDTWSVEDVENHIAVNDYECSPKLTYSDKVKILKQMEKDYDAEIGYNWQTLDTTIKTLFSDRLI